MNNKQKNIKLALEIKKKGYVFLRVNCSGIKCNKCFLGNKQKMCAFMDMQDVKEYTDNFLKENE